MHVVQIVRGAETSREKTSSGGNLGFFHLNRTIDFNTGLTAASTDTAGLITDFEYDALGRQTWIKPRDTGGVDRDRQVQRLEPPRRSPSLRSPCAP